MRKIGLIYAEHTHEVNQISCVQKLESLKVDAIILYTSWYNTNIHTSINLYQVASLRSLHSLLSRFDDTDLIVCSTKLNKCEIMLNTSSAPQNFIVLDKDNQAKVIRTAEISKLLRTDFMVSVAKLKEVISLSGSNNITVNTTKHKNFTTPVGELLETLRPKKVTCYIPTSHIPVVVSLTSYKSRFPILPKSIGSLLNQTVTPERICLAIDEEDMPYITSYISELQKSGVIEILVGDKSLGPHNKYLHAMRKYPNKPIITVDDDMVYKSDALERLYKLYLKYPKCVCARRAHLIKYDKEGKPLSYRKWINQCQDVLTPSMDLFATGVGGVLYPPNTFNWAAEDIQLMRTCAADDVFLKKYENNLGIPTVITGDIKDVDTMIKDFNAQNTALMKANVYKNRNDDYIRQLGLCKPSPFFRVIIPVYKSTTTLPHAIKSVLAQSFTDYMVIVCDDGSPEPDAKANEGTVSLLGNRGLFIHTETNLYAGAARNLAMKHYTDAKYTLFLDSDDEFIKPDIFQKLHDFILSQNSPDVVVLPYINREGKDNTLTYSKINSPASFAMEQSTGTPWAKCIRADKVMPFSEGLRRSNDVMQHYLTVDTVETVVAFTEPVVRYLERSDTTMFGTFGKKNRQSLGAITGYLKCCLELLEHEWVHNYTRTAIGKILVHITNKMLPSLVKELGVDVIAKLLEKDKQ